MKRSAPLPDADVKLHPHDLKPSEEYEAQSKGLPWNLLGRVSVVCGSAVFCSLSGNILLLSLLVPVTKPTKTSWQIYKDLTLLMLNCLINDKLSFICNFGHSVLSRQKSLLHIVFFLSTKKENEAERCRHGRAFSPVSGTVAGRVMFAALRKQVPKLPPVCGRRMCLAKEQFQAAEAECMWLSVGNLIGPWGWRWLKVRRLGNNCRSWIWVFTTCFFIPEIIACSQLEASLKYCWAFLAFGPLARTCSSDYRLTVTWESQHEDSWHMSICSVRLLTLCVPLMELWEGQLACCTVKLF